jgi:hypothetical protein
MWKGREAKLCMSLINFLWKVSKLINGKLKLDWREMGFLG